MKKYKTGALAGKFLPPQIGHAKLISVASDSCETLFVALAERPEITAKFCTQNRLPVIPAALRLEWLEKHFAERGNIHFLYMDETEIPKYPDGTREWSERFKKLIGGNPDAIFFGEEAYFEMTDKYFKDTAAVLVKRGVQTPDISAGQIRANPAKFLDLIIPPARDYFKEILK